jgi:carbamoyl-phosphate synthase small subunit
LVLEDGTILKGSGFGYPTEVTGEVVFNTGMVGYPEALTDPSYSGQILVQTYPLIGNYGVPSFSLIDKFGMPLHFESNKIQVSGYVVHRLSQSSSHWSSKKSLDEWLFEQKIPGIDGIDTRFLTKKLRVKGVMLGILKVWEDDKTIDIEDYKKNINNIPDPNMTNLVQNVTISSPIRYESGNQCRVVVIDCGVKFGILRNLLERNVDVFRVPFDFSVDKILSFEPNGILISNGPGDPKAYKKTIEIIEELLEMNIPMMGICLGNQLLALAAGADTYKLKFGHRGQNHPSIDVKTKKCYVTSQNHGYAINSKSLNGTEFKVSFINANDKTVEGIEHKKKNVFGIQFHPEASPGPYETSFLFDKFIETVEEHEN